MSVAPLSRAAGSESAVEFVVGQVKQMMREEKQRALADFDDHLDDAKCDWTNTEFEAKIMPTLAASDK